MKKTFKILLCIALIAVFLFGFFAKYQTYGVYPGLEYGYEQMLETESIVGEGLRKMGEVLIYRNRFGKIVVAQSLTALSSKQHWTRKLYDSVGRIAMNVQTTWGGVPTHLDFFNCQWSPRQFTQLVRQAGIPEECPNGPGFADFTFTTVDRYAYEVRVSYVGTARILSVRTPNGELLYDETLDAFTVNIMIQYLVLATVLSCVLVILLTVPNAIRKRKEKSKM